MEGAEKMSRVRTEQLAEVGVIEPSLDAQTGE